MSLTSGTRIGIYEIVAPIGAGGMGEVYRARDTRLNRDVALKILPDTFAADPSRVMRFRREAQLLATLNHPNIAQIYGFEEVAPQSEQAEASAAIVLELVDGRTLAERLREGPLPLDETRRHRPTDCRGSRDGPRVRHHPSRPEARQRQGEGGRHRQGARFRSGESVRSGRDGLDRLR